MLTRYESPETAFDDQRSHERRADLHVLQVFDVHGRNAAQARRSEIDRAIILRNQGRRDIKGIGDEPYGW